MCGLRWYTFTIQSTSALLAVLSLAVCHPTRYKINNNDQLEPDLIPVSSTVIPLPIYRVETSFDASAGKSSLVKPDGPVTLVTVHGNKSLAGGKETKDH
ncbi:hypothetical protein CBL_08649 [Carabus blaptoides fortunei]